MVKNIEVDIAIIGGSFGAVAGVLAALSQDYKVVMTDEFDWVGGQVTSQGLCVLDDFNVGERVGCTKRYSQFRDLVREQYIQKYGLSEFGAVQTHLCPGNARCSHLTAEPNVAHDVILKWLNPYIQNGQLTLLTKVVPVEAVTANKNIKSVDCQHVENDAEQYHITAKFFLDGTEAGDLLPLIGAPYRIGSEAKAEYNEPNAPKEANPRSIQSFTYCILLEFQKGKNFLIKKPDNYDFYANKYKFFLSSAGASRAEPANFFKPKIRKDGVRIVPFWNYRSVVDPFNFKANKDLHPRTVINVESNDYLEEAYLEHAEPEKVLAAARELSLSYLYWLQTEAPRDEGGFGYPELRPMQEATGTPDGIAQAPYVREGRRLKSLFTVTENHISSDCQPGARAASFYDSIGLGGYAIDIHRSSGRFETGVWQLTKEYQIPLRSLVCSEFDNFAVAGKSLGVSHIANGAYRLHPSEWAIGEAAGALACYCLKNKLENPRLDGAELFKFQRSIIEDGMPVYWYDDMGHDEIGFVAAQVLAIANVWAGDESHLRFEALSRLDTNRLAFLKAVEKIESTGISINEFVEPNLNSPGIRKYDLAIALMKWLDLKKWNWQVSS